MGIKIKGEEKTTVLRNLLPIRRMCKTQWFHQVTNERMRDLMGVNMTILDRVRDEQLTWCLHRGNGGRQTGKKVDDVWKIKGSN